MSTQTNIMKVLKIKSATSTGSTSSGFVNVKNASGKLIDGLFVNHVKDFDYLLFDFSTKKIDTKFGQKYNLFESKIDINLATSNNAIHIRIPSNVRARLAQFYDDLCAHYDSKNTDDSVGEIIEEWAYFFDTVRNKKLSREEEVGLIGELLTLNHLYINGHSNAIDYWFGPAGELHDFKKTGEWILEIKTSVSPNPVVKVGYIDQLEPQSLPFHLILVKLSRDKKAGKSLPEIIAEIEALLKSKKEKDRLWLLLNGMGYNDEDSHKYTQKYDLVEIERYKIDSTTITLCPANIKSAAKYKSAMWFLTASEYPMVACDPAFWKNPV